MNIEPLVIASDEAEAKFNEYSQASRDGGTATDAALANAYRTALSGQPVIALTATIHAGGYLPDGLPRLAICRADAENCWVKATRVAFKPRDRLTYSSVPDPRHCGALVGARHLLVRVPGPDEPPLGRRGHTVVPLTPPRHRPTRRRLSSCHILWEVQEWTPDPPIDPVLLRHIYGDLWAVLAQWDLTDLERAILPGRPS